MNGYKTIDELRQDNEIANNHLQSVENERSILQRDTDLAMDRLELICESILEQGLATSNSDPSEKWAHLLMVYKLMVDLPINLRIHDWT